mgnify:CR=1 FL=1
MLLNRKNLEYVVNACDAGREGELIFRRVYELSGSKLPVKRLWISSMEDAAISEGFAYLKNGTEYQNLAEAAVCRAKADWLVGMNATRAFTTTYGKTFRVGRVQTPTLAMLVERQEKIEHFVKETYYKVRLMAGDMIFVSESIKDRTEAEQLAALAVENPQSHGGEIVKKREVCAELYDLTTLQREANRLFGYTAKETLDTLQELYEEKLLTYPRTDSRYVTSDMEETLLELAGDMMDEFLDFSFYADVRRVVNPAKVTDHHAILPTKQAMKAEWTGLSEKKRSLLYLTSMQVLKAVAGDFSV